MVIIVIDYLQTKGLGISRTLVLSYEIFFLREYVRVAVVYDRSDAVLEHGLDDRARTWGTAGMEKDCRLPHRCL